MNVEPEPESRSQDLDEDDLRFQPPATAKALPILHSPRDGIPAVVDTSDGLAHAARTLAAGSGPCAVDVERASGFRYGQRAFLVQLRRHQAGTWLIDSAALPDLSLLNNAIAQTEWVIHAATQDLPSLYEVNMWPAKLFDTELAARLAGLPRVGLAAVIEQFLGVSLAKEHSAVDWSTRPLPEPWLQYAALDVEVLTDLREHLAATLEAQGKLGWLEQECRALVAAGPPSARVDPWRHVSGIHRLHRRRQLAIVHHLWRERERLARARDLAPNRVLSDAALVAAAQAAPANQEQLFAISGFARSRHSPDAWLRAIRQGMRSSEPPPMHLPPTGPPPPRQWASRNPDAWRRLQRARQVLQERSETLNVPLENLLSPETVRRLAWSPPLVLTESAIADDLRELGARPWQIENCVHLLCKALIESVKMDGVGDTTSIP